MDSIIAFWFTILLCATLFLVSVICRVDGHRDVVDSYKSCIEDAIPASACGEMILFRYGGIR